MNEQKIINSDLKEIERRIDDIEGHLHWLNKKFIKKTYDKMKIKSEVQ